MLGLIDDLIGISEAGYKAQQLNGLLNFKSAEKGLQFGVPKCNTMLIKKRSQAAINNKLTVDHWTEVSSDNGFINDKYIGEVAIKEVNEYKYLGFIISNDGNNMTNIKALKNKSNGVIANILDKLDALKLKQYYFECAIIFFNVILRGSILYASECYYNLTEYQLRALERIEESFLRKILKTTKGCPIVQLYLELGLWPARFEILKRRILFLKGILEQDQSYRVYKFFSLQLSDPTKDDWVSTTLNDLKYLEIDKSLNEIKTMTKAELKQLLTEKVKEQALKYLVQKQGFKGKEIEYSRLEIAEYFLPIYRNIDIEDRRTMFSIRNNMLDIPDNFGDHSKICICESLESMKHLYECKKMNENEAEISFEKIYNGNVNE